MVLMLSLHKRSGVRPHVSNDLNGNVFHPTTTVVTPVSSLILNAVLTRSLACRVARLHRRGGFLRGR